MKTEQLTLFDSPPFTPTVFEATLDFCIWREQIESKFGKHHERIYIDAWNRGLTSEDDFYKHYIESAI